ncbi:hypothetical protein [Breznakibacter xylanolyticus]|uniref:hypothetical protein n=1 Tax=Breznakibacter xylanolyticus TaxID=990 RepID=UPI0011B3DDEB|nr:hypothetical protein [Breznakibacter xylanolyticus]
MKTTSLQMTPSTKPHRHSTNSWGSRWGEGHGIAGLQRQEIVVGLDFAIAHGIEAVFLMARGRQETT